MPSSRFLLAAGLPLLFAVLGQAQQACNQNGCCNGLIISTNICCEGDPNVGVNDPQSSCTAGTASTLQGGALVTSAPAAASASASSGASSSDDGNIIGGNITGNGSGASAVAVNCSGSVCSTTTYPADASFGPGSSMATSAAAGSGSGSGSSASATSDASAQSSSSSHNGAMATVMPAAYLGLGVVAAAYGAM